jgi:hypothetical protein
MNTVCKARVGNGVTRKAEWYIYFILMATLSTKTCVGSHYLSVDEREHRRTICRLSE